MSSNLRSDLLRIAAEATCRIEKLEFGCFVLILQTRWFQHNQLVFVIPLVSTMGTVKQAKSLPFLLDSIHKHVDQARMSFHREMPQIIILGHIKAFSPFLVFGAEPAVIAVLLNGIRKHPADSIPSVLSNDALGRIGIEVIIVVIVVDGLFDCSCTGAVLLVAFSPLIKLIVTLCIILRPSIHGFMFCHLLLHLLSAPTASSDGWLLFAAVRE